MGNEEGLIAIQLSLQGLVYFSPESPAKGLPIASVLPSNSSSRKLTVFRLAPKGYLDPAWQCLNPRNLTPPPL